MLESEDSTYSEVQVVYKELIIQETSLDPRYAIFTMVFVAESLLMNSMKFSGMRSGL